MSGKLITLGSVAVMCVGLAIFYGCSTENQFGLGRDQSIDLSGFYGVQSWVWEFRPGSAPWGGTAGDISDPTFEADLSSMTIIQTGSALQAIDNKGRNWTGTLSGISETWGQTQGYEGQVFLQTDWGGEHFELIGVAEIWEYTVTWLEYEYDIDDTGDIYRSGVTEEEEDYPGSEIDGYIKSSSGRIRFVRLRQYTSGYDRLGIEEEAE